MKANDVLYQLQKLIKMLRKNNLDKVYFSAKLKSMVEVCKEYELKKEKKILFQLIGLLYEKELRKQYMLKKLEKLTKSFGSIVEKKKVMQYREASARVTFFSRTKQVLGSTILQYGDVVKVPTQGGFHYSVVTNIQKDIVECYPLTTASNNDLKKIGVRSVAIDDFLIIDGIEQNVRLTASKTCIPTKRAVCNKIGTYANIERLRETIAMLESA